MSNHKAIDMMIGVALSLHEELMNSPPVQARTFAREMLDQCEMELADNMPEVGLAVERFRSRDDDFGRAMLAYAEQLLRSYDTAAKVAIEVLEKVARANGSWNKNGPLQ